MKDYTKLEEKLLAHINGAGSSDFERIDMTCNDNGEPLCPNCGNALRAETSSPRIFIYGCNNCQKPFVKSPTGTWFKVNI